MNKAADIADWERMYRGLTDPEERKKKASLAKRELRRQEKKSDTGL